METTQLKSFAMSARTELLREVEARLTRVLSAGSHERVEHPRALHQLEDAITQAGGGAEGRRQIVDRAAYTWFNRIVALRFMDANGYTGIGVVSPAADQVGQPEVLAVAKRGQIDPDVVTARDATAVMGLLDGTRDSKLGSDAQSEAYAFLLTSYCRHWHKALPFMFEREADYTELLMPSNLLAEDSVLGRITDVLTEEVCQDVEVIGWLYQYYIAERKDEVFAGFKKKKASAAEIPAATQLFTPHWIVRYLVENSVGRLWMLNHPNSKLVEQMEYYIAPIEEETEFLKVSTPEELTVIDPACGSGHMLTYAFDLLYAIYEEEGYAPSQIPNLILEHNLYGTEIDHRAGTLAGFALSMKAADRRKLFLNNPVAPNICVIEPLSFTTHETHFLATANGDRETEAAFWNQFEHGDTFGALIRPDAGLSADLSDHLASLHDDGDLLHADTLERATRVAKQARYLSQKYSVAVANPPYMGSKQMNSLLGKFMKDNYPDSKADLFAAFIERCIFLTRPVGNVAMITMQQWMFLASYGSLRGRILSSATIETLAQLGPGAFDSISGEIVSTSAFTLRSGRGDADKRGSFLRLTEPRGEEGKMAAFKAALKDGSNRHEITRSLFAQLPGSPIAYWLPEELLSALRDRCPLSDTYEAGAGMSTGDSARFLRHWHEVSYSRINFNATDHNTANDSQTKWYPYNKGGGPRRWTGYLDFVVNWHDEGREIKDWVVNNPRDPNTTHWSRRLFNIDKFFQPGVTWSAVSGADFGVRLVPPGVIPGQGSRTIFGPSAEREKLLAVLNSSFSRAILEAYSPTLNVESGSVLRVPALPEALDTSHVDRAIKISDSDWQCRETSPSYAGMPGAPTQGTIENWCHEVKEIAKRRAAELEVIDRKNDHVVAKAYKIENYSGLESSTSVHTLTLNPYDSSFYRKRVGDLISYAVGCAFGRYSLDRPGLILGDQGATLADYLLKVPEPTFMPDEDNVIPVVDGEWFEDDIVDQVRLFLRTVFGAEHLGENLRFINETLGIKDLRDYFVKTTGRGTSSKFYDDHVKRYKKRPIYWMFSSPQGSFNALVYLHRYGPATASTVLTYLREYITKLDSALAQAERADNNKEADRLRKVLLELREYEHDVLYPLATENIALNLDDGVRVNYPKLGSALRKIPGLEASVE